MISPQDIRTVTFDKTMRGYRTEDVDAFLQQCASDFERISAEKAETEQKLYVLAQKIEEYRKDEDNLKTALLNAQRMGENVIKEAKQKAESILRDASIKAEDVARAAVDQVQEENLEYERIKAEVAQFKNNVLSLYKQHIESLTTLPGKEEEEEIEQPVNEELPVQADQPLEPAAADENAAENDAEQAPAEVEQTTAQPLTEEEETVEGAVENIIDTFPDLAETIEEPQENFFEDSDPALDEIVIEQPSEPSIEPEKPQAPEQDFFNGFQGIKFSD